VLFLHLLQNPKECGQDQKKGDGISFRIADCRFAKKPEIFNSQ